MNDAPLPRWKQEMERSSERTMRSDAARGGAASLIAQGTRFGLQLGNTAILARLLAIEDFGIFAVATAVTMVLSGFRDAGLKLANVQAKSITHGQASSLLAINAGIGLLLAGIILLMTPVMLAIYDEPALLSVLPVLALSFFIGSLGVQFSGVLHRRMRLISLAAIDVGSLAVSVIVGVTAALMDLGVISLALAHLGLQTSMTVGAIALGRWMPTRPAPWREVRPLVRFGLSLAFSGALNKLGANSDRAILGAVNTQATGLYTKALNLAALPLEKISPAFAAVAIPTLSQLHDRPAQYRRAYERLLRTLTLLSTPITCVLLLEAEIIIGVVLGEDWLAAVPLFRALCVGGLILPVWNSTGWLFVSQGRGRQMLIWNLVDSVVKVAAAAIGVIWGALGLAIAFSVRYVVMLPFLAKMMGSEGPVGPRLFAKQITMVVVLAAPGLAAAYLVTLALGSVWGGEIHGLGSFMYLSVYSVTVLCVHSYRDQLIFTLHSLRGKLVKEGLSA